MNFCLQRKVLLALEDAGIFTSGGLVKDKVYKCVFSEHQYDHYLLTNLSLMLWTSYAFILRACLC